MSSSDPKDLFDKSWILLVTTFVIICVIFSPRIKIPKTKYSFQIHFGWAPLIGVILLLMTTTISLQTVAKVLLCTSHFMIHLKFLLKREFWEMPKQLFLGKLSSFFLHWAISAFLGTPPEFLSTFH